MSAVIVLRNELESDPLGRNYAAMSDAQVIESINELNRPAPLRPIESDVLLGWASGGANSGLPSPAARFQRLEDAAENGSPEVAGAAAAALLFLTKNAALDVEEYAVQIAALIVADYLTSDEQKELVALATPPEISRAAELSLPVIGIGLTTNARK